MEFTDDRELLGEHIVDVTPPAARRPSVADESGRGLSLNTYRSGPQGEAMRPKRWEGFVEVCNTCDRRAAWPFCEHKTDDGSWYRLVRVREVGR